MARPFHWMKIHFKLSQKQVLVGTAKMDIRSGAEERSHFGESPRTVCRKTKT